MDIDLYVEKLAAAALDGATGDGDPARDVSLKGLAVELWADRGGGRCWLVADQADAEIVAKRYGVPAGEIWTSTEIEIVAKIIDPAVVQEVARWKRRLDGTVSGYAPSRQKIRSSAKEAG